MEVKVIPLSYFKKISENFPTPSIHVLSHHYQLIVLHTGCFTTCGHYCRRWFPRFLWPSRSLAHSSWDTLYIYIYIYMSYLSNSIYIAIQPARFDVNNFRAAFFTCIQRGLFFYRKTENPNICIKIFSWHKMTVKYDVYLKIIHWSQHFDFETI